MWDPALGGAFAGEFAVGYEHIDAAQSAFVMLAVCFPTAANLFYYPQRRGAFPENIAGSVGEMHADRP
jgi:hypothetical protein